MRNACPASDCRGGSADRQNDMAEGSLAQLPEEHRKIMGNPMRCSYCGCVYASRDKRIFGYYDNDIIGQGWHPSGWLKSP